MKIKTRYFGELDVDMERIVCFPEGIIGFPDYHFYTIIEDTKFSSLFWLQSIENPSLVFPIADPWEFYKGYELEISDNDLKFLGGSKLEVVSLYVIATLHFRERRLSLNLIAPLTVNFQKGVARQVILDKGDYGIRHYFDLKLQEPVIKDLSLPLKKV